MFINRQFKLIQALIMICCSYCLVDASASQSYWSLSSPGLVFKPKDEQALFISQTFTDSKVKCAFSCHSTIDCRIFDYDASSRRCRLFEGNVEVMGGLTGNTSYPQSVVGSIELNAELFGAHGQPCSSCQQNRFLSCINGSCQCPSRTYFDGSICQSQKVLGNRCVNATECRQDLNYTCLPRQQCGREFFRM